MMLSQRCPRDVVEKLGDNQVELQLLLDPSTKLQNRALGAHAA